MTRIPTSLAATARAPRSPPTRSPEGAQLRPWPRQLVSRLRRQLRLDDPRNQNAWLGRSAQEGNGSADDLLDPAHEHLIGHVLGDHLSDGWAAPVTMLTRRSRAVLFSHPRCPPLLATRRGGGRHRRAEGGGLAGGRHRRCLPDGVLLRDGPRGVPHGQRTGCPTMVLARRELEAAWGGWWPGSPPWPRRPTTAAARPTPASPSAPAGPSRAHPPAPAPAGSPPGRPSRPRRWPRPSPRGGTS